MATKLHNSKLHLLLIVCLCVCTSYSSAKVIRTNTKLPLAVKTADSSLNLTNLEILQTTNLLTKLSSNEIDPNVHPIENSSPGLSDEPEAPITNEIVPETAAAAVEPDANPEVSSDVNPESGDTNPVNTDDPNPLNKFCKCSEYSCDCCRMFSLPILPVRAPTCAKLKYLGNNKMSIQLKYGDVVLVTRTVSGRKTTPICIPMPGGYSQFCARVYGLAKGANDFKACLGFELRADDELEASLRVSCFRFGAQGFAVSEAEPLPSETEKDEDDDDDDIFGLGLDDGDDDDDDASDDDDDDDDDDDGDLFGDDDDDNDTEDDAEYPSEQESPDYGGFSLLDDIFSTGQSKKLKKTSTQSKSSKVSTKSTNSTISQEDNETAQTFEPPATKEVKQNETITDEHTTDKRDKKIKMPANKDEYEDDEDDDDENDEEDDDDDDEEEEDDDGNKIEANQKKKEKFSTMEYLLRFMSSVMKLF